MSEIVISWIDDDSYEIFTFVLPLTEMGYEVEPYITYSEALDSIDDIIASDLILLDIILPSPMMKNLSEADKKDKYWGGRLLKTLLNDYQYAKPILIFSVVGDAENTVDINLLKAPNVTSVPKFRTPKELKEAVLKALKRPNN